MRFHELRQFKKRWFYQSNFIRSALKSGRGLLHSWSGAYVNSTLFLSPPARGVNKRRRHVPGSTFSVFSRRPEEIYSMLAQTSRPRFTCIIKLCHVDRLRLQDGVSQTWIYEHCWETSFPSLVFKTVCYVTDIRSKFFPLLFLLRK